MGDKNVYLMLTIRTTTWPKFSMVIVSYSRHGHSDPKSNKITQNLCGLKIGLTKRDPPILSLLVKIINMTNVSSLRKHDYPHSFSIQ